MPSTVNDLNMAGGKYSAFAINPFSGDLIIAHFTFLQNHLKDRVINNCNIQTKYKGIRSPLMNLNTSNDRYSQLNYPFDVKASH